MTNIKPFTTSKGNFLAVLLPDGYRSFAIIKAFIKKEISFDTKDYSIIGLQSEINEEQAKEIIPKSERHPDLEKYEDYTSESNRYAYLLNTAKESFNSLMASIECYTVNPSGTEPENKSNWDLDQQNTGNWLILKKNS